MLIRLSFIYKQVALYHRRWKTEPPPVKVSYVPSWRAVPRATLGPQKQPRNQVELAKDVGKMVGSLYGSSKYMTFWAIIYVYRK